MSQTIETLNAYLHQQAPILNSLPVAIAIKDCELNYRYSNPIALQNAGFSQVSDVYEHNDYEMPWYDQAPIFQSGGHKVLSGMNLLTFDPITTKSGVDLTYLTQQTPIYDAQQSIIGICLLTRVIAQHKMVSYSRYVTETDKQQFAEIIGPYIDNTTSKSFNLTANEQMTLYYLLRGYTMEAIAERLCRSYYTIKDRVERLKAQFGCQTKAQLINTAIQKGYLQLIPEQIKA